MTHNTVTILDGGMGRELQRRGAPFQQPEWSALAMIEAPETVQQVHSAFLRSGSQVITTNSYALVPFHIGESRFADQAEQLAARSGQVARDAVNAHHTPALVAASLPPLFGSYRADLYQPDEVERIATPLIRGLAPYADLWLLETQSLIAESVAVCDLLNRLGQADKAIWVSFTLEDDQPATSLRLCCVIRS